MKRAVFCGIALGILGFAAAQARPEMAGGSAASENAAESKFTVADTNKDAFLSREEFAKAFPGLKPEAFALIDKDGDGRIAAGEWRAFSSGHGGSPGVGHGAAPMPPAKQGPGDALPVVPAPQSPRQGAGK